MEKETTYEEYTGEKTPEALAEEAQANMTLTRHLEELRVRIIRSLLAVACGSAVSYYYIDEIMAFIMRPAGKLYYMQPAEAFFTYFKVALFAGFLLSLPFVLYHVWAFFLPALTAKERAVIGMLVPASVGLFLAGIAFSYYLVLPIAIRFFLDFASDTLQPMLSVGRYFDFIVMFMLPFGFIFELPLVILVLARLGIISSAFLAQKRRIVILLCFVIGALVSPPDVVSQTMIAVPMVLLYELSIWIVRYVLRK